jgi:hypothetical protein
MEKCYELKGGNEVFNEKLLAAAVDWVKNNPTLKPSFSTACGMVFADNSAADDFDIDMGAFSFFNNIELEGKYVPFLYFEAEQKAIQEQNK